MLLKLCFHDLIKINKFSQDYVFQLIMAYFIQPPPALHSCCSSRRPDHSIVTAIRDIYAARRVISNHRIKPCTLDDTHYWSLGPLRTFGFLRGYLPWNQWIGIVSHSCRFEPNPIQRTNRMMADESNRNKYREKWHGDYLRSRCFDEFTKAKMATWRVEIDHWERKHVFPLHE